MARATARASACANVKERSCKDASFSSRSNLEIKERMLSHSPSGAETTKLPVLGSATMETERWAGVVAA